MRRGLGGWQTAAGAAVVRGSRGMLPTGVARGPEDCRGVWVPPGWMRGQGLPLTRGPLNESLLPREQRRLNTAGRRAPTADDSAWLSPFQTPSAQA